MKVKRLLLNFGRSTNFIKTVYDVTIVLRDCPKQKTSSSFFRHYTLHGRAIF